MTDSRVTSMERTDIRELDPNAVGGAFDVLVADLSFISLRTVASSLIALCRVGAPMVLLVKPQFEVGRQIASEGKGVISEDSDRQMALEKVRSTFERLRCDTIGVMECPIHGADGNREYLLALKAPSDGPVTL